MNATIKVKVSELNMAFIERIKSFFSDKEDAELTITYDNHKVEYLNKLRQSKKQLEERKSAVTFTIEELEAFTRNAR